ncbi:hypothetical protein P7K49_012728 [Saguinus oedipus]|uniref:Uncharacterized protein n=1 Tax=Saguinus oedipus TaxID=9490 RepID=A0ABQ9VDZ5_SAGOE|nr:hypothetical protein P7K49_012728 [Saguinus oedipus]
MAELSDLEKLPIEIFPEIAWQLQSVRLVVTEKQSEKPQRRGNYLQVAKLNKRISFSTLQWCGTVKRQHIQVTQEKPNPECSLRPHSPAFL